MHSFMSAAEAAEVLGVTRETARLYATTGRIAATRTSAGWMLDADAVAEEAAMQRVRRNHPHGRITPAEAERMAAALPHQRDVIKLLTDNRAEPVRAASPAGDGEDAEFAHLFPPGTFDRRQQRAVSASAPWDDDDELPVETAALYPPGTFGPAADRRVAEAERVAAAARRKPADDELLEAIYGAAGDGTTHAVFTGTHSHAHSTYDGQGGTHSHAHVHAGDGSHDPGTGGHVQLPSRSHPELGDGQPG